MMAQYLVFSAGKVVMITVAAQLKQHDAAK